MECRHRRAWVMPALGRWGGVGSLRKKQYPVVARPQQKSDPTKVNENNKVDPSPSEVCAGPFREK